MYNAAQPLKLKTGHELRSTFHMKDSVRHVPGQDRLDCRGSIDEASVPIDMSDLSVVVLRVYGDRREGMPFASPHGSEP